MVVKEVDRELVGCHHDCCVRNLANYNERKKISQEFLTKSLHICPSQCPLLSIHLLVYIPTYLLIYPFICPSFYLSGHLSISIYKFNYQSISLFSNLTSNLSIYLWSWSIAFLAECRGPGRVPCGPPPCPPAARSARRSGTWSRPLACEFAPPLQH